MPSIGASTTRDWAGEIDEAIAALTGSAGPVTVEAGGAPPTTNAVGVERRIEFRYHEPVDDSGDSWLPFQGDLGQLAAQGATLLVGLGPVGSCSAELARYAATVAGAHLCKGSVAVSIPADVDGLTQPLVDGLASSFAGPGKVCLLVEETSISDARAAVVAADTVRLARRLVSAPANLLTPERAADWAQDIARRAGLMFSMLDPDQIRAQGFGGLAAIGGGSTNGPRLVRLSHAGTGDGPVISLVGKGITFDSGGLSLKSPAAMQSMRLDVAGAATVLAVMGALKRIGCRATVHAVLPFAENLPGPGAVRPGDVITAWNGTQIQILDTDFEGRVVLADALALAAADRPDLLVDLATLTYQAEVALGPQIAAVLGRDDEAADDLLRAAADAGEPMWRLPWAPRYLDQVRTPFGVRNHPLRDSGRALTAALFLGEFVPPTVPWAHCDMTGPAWNGDASIDGATGFGARTLLRLVQQAGPARRLH